MLKHGKRDTLKSIQHFNIGKDTIGYEICSTIYAVYGSDSGSNTLLPSYEGPIDFTTKKNHSKDLAGTYHFDSCKCIDFHGRQFPRQLCHASGHRDTLPVLPPLAQYPLGHQRLGIFNGTALMSFPPNIALCIDCQIHPQETLLSPCLVATTVQFAISVVFVLLYFLIFKNHFSELINSLNSAYVWSATLPVSLIFILLNIMMQPQKYETMHVNRVYRMYVAYLLLAFFLFNVIYLIFYLVAVILLRNAKTEERVRLFEMQESQYLAQQRYITESAKQRHDFRQQLHSLAQMAQNKEYDALTSHLANCVAAIPESPTCYCRNIPVNALLNYYDHLFASQGITKKWSIQIPAECLVNDTELCSLIGNILENVSAGCLTLPDAENRLHTLNICLKNGSFLAIRSENRFDGKVDIKNGHYLSTRNGGSGIGLRSIQAIAEKHGGMAYFSHTTDTFTIKLIIKILP